MCDAIEGVTSESESVPGEEGVGLEIALENYAVWYKDAWLPGSGYFSPVVMATMAHQL
jgi:hypothetical protein